MPRITIKIFLANLITSVIVFSQPVVEYEPLFPSADKPIRILFYADRGTKGLMGFSGDVYAHTGIITDLSTKPSDWKYVKTGWGQNTNETKLNRLGKDLYELKIDDIRSYYGVSGSEKILRLAFVFRSADTSKEGKDDGGKDIFIDLTSSGLNIALIHPKISLPNPLFTANDTTVNILAVANSAENKIKKFEIWINDNLIQSTDNDSISHSVNLSTPGHWDIRIYAEDTNDLSDSLFFRMIYVGSAIIQSIPDGIADGINHNADGTTTFVLHAPYKNHVFVIGDFNNWMADNEYLMKRSGNIENARWWITIDNLTTKDHYLFQYLVDGSIRIADPYSEKILEPNYNSGIPKSVYPNPEIYPDRHTKFDVSVLETNTPDYIWTTSSYDIPEPSHLNIYEILVRDFSAQHRFEAIIDSLDYLERLGINAIQLMPITEFQGNNSWGYNPSFLFAIDKYYGSRNEFKSLVDSCHARGIAVIMDLVINHSYGSSPFFRLYNDGKPTEQNPWFNREHNFANTSAHWGYDWNHESPDTKKLFKRAISFWMGEYKIDGFRFDFTKGIGNNYKPLSDPWGSLYDADRIDLLKEISQNVWDNNKDGIVIFEHLSEDKEEKELAEHGALMWSNGNHNYGENLMGYYSGDNASLSWTYFKNRGWSVPNALVYMESHDEERIIYKALNYGASNGNHNIKRLDIALERLKTIGSIYFLLPGPKMIWQFGELGYDQSIDYNGRLGNKPILWNYFDDRSRRNVYDSWSYFMSLRKSFAIFSNPESKIQTWLNGSIKKVIYQFEGNNAVLVSNLDLQEADIIIDLPHKGIWFNPFLNDSIAFDSTKIALSIPAGRFILLTDFIISPAKEGVTLLSVNQPQDQASDSPFLVYPNPSNSSVVINYQLKDEQHISVNIFDILGRHVVQLVNDFQRNGNHKVVWHGKDFSNETVSPGVYLAKITIGEKRYNHKIVLLK